MLYNYLEVEMLVALSQELSPREKEVWKYLMRGMEMGEIEKRLGISIRTVYRDKESILQKITDLMKLRVF